MRQTGSPCAGFQSCLPLCFNCPGISIVKQGSQNCFFKARRDYNLMRQHLSWKLCSIYDQYNSKPDNKVNIIKSGTWSNDHLQLGQPCLISCHPSLPFQLSQLLLSFFKMYLLTATCQLYLLQIRVRRFRESVEVLQILLLQKIFQHQKFSSEEFCKHL